MDPPDRLFLGVFLIFLGGLCLVGAAPTRRHKGLRVFAWIVGSLLVVCAIGFVALIWYIFLTEGW